MSKSPLIGFGSNELQDIRQRAVRARMSRRMDFPFKLLIGLNISTWMKIQMYSLLFARFGLKNTIL